MIVLIVLNLMLTRKKKPIKDTRTAREKNIDKIAGLKSAK